MIFLYHNYAKNDEFNLLINNIMSDKDFTDNLENEYGLKQFLTSEKIFPLREGTTHFKFKIKTFVFEMDVFLYPLENLKKPFKKYIQVTSLTFGLEGRY